MNPINQELKDYRVLIEHYEKILKEDELLCKGELSDKDRPRLTAHDKLKINEKLEILREQRDILLLQDNEF